MRTPLSRRAWLAHARGIVNGILIAIQETAPFVLVLVDGDNTLVRAS